MKDVLKCINYQKVRLMTNVINNKVVDKSNLTFRATQIRKLGVITIVLVETSNETSSQGTVRPFDSTSMNFLFRMSPWPTHRLGNPKSFLGTRQGNTDLTGLLVSYGNKRLTDGGFPECRPRFSISFGGSHDPGTTVFTGLKVASTGFRSVW